MLSKLITTILLLHQYALINSIDYTQPLTHEQAIAVLTVAGWDESLHDEALQIMECESEFIPLASGDYWGTRPQARGLFQVHHSYYDTWDCNSVLNGGFIGYGAYYECSEGVSYNPYHVVDNAILARRVYERSNSWAMWSCRKVLTTK